MAKPPTLCYYLFHLFGSPTLCPPSLYLTLSLDSRFNNEFCFELYSILTKMVTCYSRKTNRFAQHKPKQTIFI